jgi:hypothetical protein
VVHDGGGVAACQHALRELAEEVLPDPGKE